MKKIYLLISVIVLFNCAGVYANDPLMIRNMVSGSESGKQLTHTEGVQQLVEENKTGEISIMNLNSIENIPAAYRITRAGTIVNGINTSAHSFEVPGVNGDVNRHLDKNLFKRQAHNAPRIIDFMNSLSRMAARHHFTRTFSIFGKIKLGTQFINVGLNF